mmetsp:Transcript_50164/g.130237  ORF Transcript_50164/g.130237 Transcript_50164/m.130237 type:complete len:213 (+) Transcript_50164:705-1343(+)
MTAPSAVRPRAWDAVASWRSSTPPPPRRSSRACAPAPSSPSACSARAALARRSCSSSTRRSWRPPRSSGSGPRWPGPLRPPRCWRSASGAAKDTDTRHRPRSTTAPLPPCLADQTPSSAPVVCRVSRRRSTGSLCWRPWRPTTFSWRTTTGSRRPRRRCSGTGRRRACSRPRGASGCRVSPPRAGWTRRTTGQRLRTCSRRTSASALAAEAP